MLLPPFVGKDRIISFLTFGLLPSQTKDWMILSSFVAISLGIPSAFARNWVYPPYKGLYYYPFSIEGGVAAGPLF